MQKIGLTEILIIISILVRILGAIVCVNQAALKNGNRVVWGILGFLFPIISMIIILTIKPLD
jgi:hypothetical protein